MLAYRFFTGLGLGGATPAFLALGGEFAPVSKRGVFVSIAFAAFPFGGLVGALTSSYVIPNFGWQFIFYIGGTAPLLVAVVLAVWLPESLRFLMARNIRLDEVRRTLERIAPGEIGPDVVLVASPERENGLALGRILYVLHGAGNGDGMDADRSAFRRLFDFGRRTHHRPQ